MAREEVLHQVGDIVAPFGEGRESELIASKFPFQFGFVCGRERGVLDGADEADVRAFVTGFLHSLKEKTLHVGRQLIDPFEVKCTTAGELVLRGVRGRTV
jgi:hypothetical protein